MQQRPCNKLQESFYDHRSWRYNGWREHANAYANVGSVGGVAVMEWNYSRFPKGGVRNVSSLPLRVATD